MSEASFGDWIPIHVDRRGPEPIIDWCYAGSQRFTHPFFQDTIQQMLRKPFSLLFRRQTSLAFLDELAESSPGLAPSGFIFHMSRCGSTLVAQMLAALPQNIVISEAPPIDSVLRLNTDDPARRARGLKFMLSALGRPRGGGERHYFIKFDSWNTLDLDLIRRAFPDVPWIFLYRNPVEVMVSQIRQRGMQMIPGVIDNGLAGIDAGEATNITAEEYCARVLARICDAALTHADDPNALLVNYDQLPDAVTTDILKHFRVSYSSEEIDLMNAGARFNSKTPSMFFEPDRDSKISEATIAAREAADAWLEPLYRKLETIRTERKDNL